MNITKMTIGRLYNLGSYEHVRYELTVEVPAGESPATAIVGVEKILAALSPRTHTHSRDELGREWRRIERMELELKDLTAEEFRRRNGHFEGTPEEYVQRCKEMHGQNVAERNAWEERSAKARKMMDDLGGAAKWRDAKLDWEDYSDTE